MKIIKMAASSSLLEQINDITECSVCAEMMVDPKMLPCIHTFCFKCLDQHWKDKQSGDKVPCPLCRKEFEIPTGGIGNLQSNIIRTEAARCTERIIQRRDCQM